jgi:putative transposase
MANEVVTKRGIAVRLACQVFTISQSYFRYEGKKNADNELIANWLRRLTDNNRN